MLDFEFTRMGLQSSTIISRSSTYLDFESTRMGLRPSAMILRASACFLLDRLYIFLEVTLSQDLEDNGNSPIRSHVEKISGMEHELFAKLRMEHVAKNYQ